MENKNRLDLNEQIYLATLLLYRCETNFSLTETDFQNFSVNEKYSNQVFYVLCQKEIIEFDDTTDEIKCNLNVTDDELHAVQNLLNQTPTEIIKNQKEIVEFWKLIASYEIQEYFELLLKKKFNISQYNDQDNIRNKFTNLLKNFAQGQIYSMLYSSVNYVLKKNENLDDDEIVGYITGCTFRHANNAITKDWNVFYYDRPYAIKQSNLSKCFFTNILGFDDNSYLHITIEQFLRQTYARLTS